VFFSSFFSFLFLFLFFFPISFILCSYTFIGPIALALAHYIVYFPLWICDSMPLCFPLVSSHELHLVHTVFLFGCFVNHVPYIHTYVRHQPPIDYSCTCSCSWMGSHTWHWYLHFMCLNCIKVAVVYIYLLSIEQVDTDVIGVW